MNIDTDYRLLDEHTLLGTMVLENTRGKLEQIFATNIAPKHFRSRANRIIFEGIVRVYQQGLPLHEPQHLLKAIGADLPDAGGAEFIVQLAQLGMYVQQPEAYAHRVIRSYVADEFTESLAQAESLGFPEEAGLSAIAQRVEKAYRELSASSAARMDTGILGTFEYVPPSGIPTGMSIIDDMQSCHGYPKGQLSMVCAKQKGGKTAFLTQTALYAAEIGKSVGYAVFADLDEPSLQMRAMKCLCGMQDTPRDFASLQRWDEAQQQMLSYGIRTLGPRRIDQPKTVETLASWLEYESQKASFDVVMVDYAQKMGTSNPKAKTLYDTAVIVSDMLADLADRYQIALVVASQITPSKENGDTTKGGRVWEEDAGLVIRIEAPDIETQRYRRILSVPYSRFGPSHQQVECTFDPAHLTIREGF